MAPCHPDRVRRNHEPDAEAAAADRLFADTRQRIAEAEAAQRAADAVAGVTANVIEGESDDAWGV